ncbi:MAG TPA: DUF2079 domain-containing protein [Chloroflexota bacterium]|nr:DUF2079 domain-containing protein [Chloroflexota bacterium]
MTAAGSVALLATGFAAAFSLLGLRELDTGRVALGDVALFDQMLWTTMHGHLLQFTSGIDPPANFLGTHFSLSLLILSPLTLVSSDSGFLVVVQAVGLALGAVPIALQAGRRLSLLAVPVVALAYVINPVLTRSMQLTFHETPLCIAPLGFALYFQLQKRWRLTFLCAALALLVKDEIGFVVVGLGLFAVAFQRQRAQGLGLAVLGMFWAVATLAVGVPHFNGGQSVYFMKDYAYLGASSPFGILLKLVENPLLALRHLTTPSKLAFVAFLIAPLGLLPFVGWRILLLAVPTLAYLLLGDTPYRHDPYFAYYASPVVPFLFFAAIEGLARVGRWLAPPVALAFLLGSSVAGYLLLTGAPGSFTFQTSSFQPTARDIAIKRTLLALPANLSVSSTINLSPWIDRRFNYRLFPEVFVATDVYAVDLQNWAGWGPYPANFNSYHAALRRLLQLPGYTAAYQQPGFVLVRRGSPPAPRVPQQAVFGQRLRLIGYDAPTGPLHPGQIIRVVLHWQALRPLATAYTEFLHLGTPANDKVAQTDGWPWDGYFPTAQWAAGEQVLDPRRLRLPANAEPGSYVLRVGWYVNGAHGLTNLTLPNGQQSVALGPFTVAAR